MEYFFYYKKFPSGTWARSSNDRVYTPLYKTKKIDFFVH